MWHYVIFGIVTLVCACGNDDEKKTRINESRNRSQTRIKESETTRANIRKAVETEIQTAFGRRKKKIIAEHEQNLAFFADQICKLEKDQAIETDPMLKTELGNTISKMISHREEILRSLQSFE